ncbi:peptidoglycan-binding protein [Vineibacter terrae]|uniref:peptidoglycan-binding protein n=1 Tax=Vineibacter terrae TaxID=2586908 RepID=UPI0015B5D26A|nr:peptidoglycan-binding protein [Vineibacter terrae]
MTREQLAAIMPRAHATGRAELWLPSLNAQMPAYRIDRERRIEMFLATIAEETGELQVQAENLSYTGERLYELFAGTFRDLAQARAVAAQGPEAIANWIYADARRSPGFRLGNNAPDDGWRYRGRGPMQLTGKANYFRFFAAVGMPLDTDPDYLLTPEGGAQSAAHFWAANGCNEIADSGDFTALTRRVNGGLINLATRQYYWDRAQAAIGETPMPEGEVPPRQAQPRLLLEGTTGDDVRALQATLNRTSGAPGLVEDGHFGPATGGAVKVFQARAGLHVDGLVGPLTRAALVAAAVPDRAPPAMPTSSATPAPRDFWAQLGELLRRVF